MKGVQDYFKDPATRPKAIAASVLLGGALAYGAYHFWINRDQVAADVKKVAHSVEHAAKKAGHEVEKVLGNTEQAVEKGIHWVSKKIAPPKTRLATFKELHLQRFVEAKQAAFKGADRDIIDYSTLIRIQQLAIEMSENDFRKVVKLNREHRRKCLEHDKAKYEEIVIQGEKDFETIFKENLHEILAECEISRDKYEKSMAEHVKTDDKVYLEGANLYDVMVNRLPAVNEPVKPNQEYVVQIHNFMMDHYQKIFYKAIHKEFFTDIKEKMLFDMIHEKYGIEEEDLRKLRKEFDTFEVRNLREKLENLIVADENQFGEFPTK